MAVDVVQVEPSDSAPAAPETVDFFISRSGRDVAMGRRVHQVLTAAGYSCVLQDKDFGTKNFLVGLARALRHQGDPAPLWLCERHQSAVGVAAGLLKPRGAAGNRPRPLLNHEPEKMEPSRP